MFPVLYDSVNIGVVPNHYGIGVLTDSISCEVVEERNGSYELKLKYPSSGKYANQLIPRAILKVKPNYIDDPQLFRIYKVGKAIGSSFTINARHISYDMSGFPITSGSATNIGDALRLLQAKANGFSITTDKSLNANFKVSEPSSVRSWFGGKAGSILDLYGPGEWKYDNFSATFLSARGVDRGVTIRYGKNLTKMENTDDSSNLVTGIMAFWKSADDNPTTILSNTISTGVNLDVIAVQVLDASDVYENEPTVAQLDAYVNNYIQNHLVASVKKNIKFDFAQISRLLKDRIDLCDTIHIIYEDYNINMTAKCISTTWDVLNERYTEIEVGEPKTNIADTIVSINQSLTEQLTENQVVSAIQRATDLITGNSGGYVVLHDSDEDGYPDELLIMNTSDISTATKVWRWNLSGLGYSKTGYDGTFGLAMTMDGAIVADYISTGNLIFGGAGAYNTNGKLEIQDASGNVICRFDKNGANVKGNITAESFTADAGNNVNAEILTKDYVISPIGKKAGLFINSNSSELPIVGIGVDPDRANLDASVFVANGTDLATYPKVATIRTLNFNEMTGVGYDSTYRKARTGSSDRDQADTWLRGGEYHYLASQNNYEHVMRSELALVCTSAYASNRLITASVVGEKSSSSTRGRADLQIAYNPGKNITLANTKTLQVISMTTNDSSNSAYQLISMNNMYTNKHITIDNSNDQQYISMSSGGTSRIYINGDTGNIQCVSLTQTSSKKYKKKINTLTDEEAKKILALRPVTYDFKDEEMGTNMRGFIAEEVDEVIPELVKHTKDYPNPTVTIDEDGNEVVQEQDDELSLDYTAMIPYLTKMLQLQQKQIDAQQKQIDELRNELNKLKGE